MMLQDKVSLVTGSARRIGATIAQRLHAEGSRVVLHYGQSAAEAEELAESLNEIREDSAMIIEADLLEVDAFDDLISEVDNAWGRLDVLVNNASTFYPTPVGDIAEADWHDLMGSNLKAPLFLSQAATPMLRDAGGCIINIVDIHARKPLREHPVYCAAKAGLAMLTQSLAKELGPDIRVNGVSPGAILWPESGLDEEQQNSLLEKTALKRQGTPNDIAGAVLWLATADYVTGEIIAVDGGRSLS